MKIHHNVDGSMWTGFECESLAKKYAEKVGGVVKFSPLPDYMGMIEYWIVTWQEKK